MVVNFLFFQDLYNLGARKIVVIGLPPFGCLPSQRTLAGGIQRDCVSLYNQAAQKYNPKLPRKLSMLQKKLSGATIVYGDIYEMLLHIIQRPSDYGKFIITIDDTSLAVNSLIYFYTNILYHKLLQVLWNRRTDVVGQESLKVGHYVIENQIYVLMIPSMCFGIVSTLQRGHMRFL